MMLHTSLFPFPHQHPATPSPSTSSPATDHSPPTPSLLPDKFQENPGNRPDSHLWRSGSASDDPAFMASRSTTGTAPNKHHHHHHHHHEPSQSHKHKPQHEDMYALQTDASSPALVKFDDGDDHVLAVLHSDAVTYQDMEALVSGLNPQRAQDILMSFRILSTLSQYLEETDSWTFCLLNNYDFQNNVRQFDLDVAIVVGKRAEHLLAEIYAWNIPKLKRMVTRFTAYHSDEATILTVLVFRIVSKYSDLEFTLQLALSRATLIKIHYEMAGLFSKLPGGSEASTSDAASRQRNMDLVAAYRQFVSQLLDEIETTPFESVQQELFQVVRDLKSMFSKFSDQYTLKSLESDSPRDETFFDLSSSVPSLSQQQSSRLPPLAEEHEQKVDMSSSMYSDTSVKSSLSESLPAMMQAFEAVRHQQEFAKFHQQQRAPAMASTASDTTPPDTPVRSSRASDMYKSPATNSMSSSSLFSSPPSSISTGTVRSSSQWGSSAGSTPTPTPQRSSLVSKPGSEAGSGAMQVKMISNRMMIEVNGRFVDMQEWAANQNSPPASSSAGSVMGDHIPPMHIAIPHAPASPGSVPHGYGLGTLFQPFLRPAGKAVVGSPKVKGGDGDAQQQLVVRDARPGPAKAKSIDGILAQTGSDEGSKDKDTSSGFALDSNGLMKPAAAMRGPAMPRKPTVASLASTSGPAPAASSSATATLNSSSWIKGVLGKAEEQFGKNYTTAMNF